MNGFEQNQQKIGRVIARAWTDEGFKDRLIADPITSLRAEGIEVPEGVHVSVVENTPSRVHLVLPPKPDENELSEESFEKLSPEWVCKPCCSIPLCW
jgi:hypothetical protein